MDSLSQAQTLNGATTADELSKLREHISKINKGVIVEIGSYLGRSSVVIGLEGQGRGNKIFFVDPFLETTKEQFIENIESKGVKDYTVIAKRSEEALKSIPKKIDFLFVDGDHWEVNEDVPTSGVKPDCDNFLPRVKKGCFVAFHDYGSSWEDVKRVVDSRKEIEIIEIVDTLCIARKK